MAAVNEIKERRELAAVRREAARVERARASEVAARGRLVAAIRAAVDAGITVREVGEAAGVSGQYVSQVYNAKKEKP